MFDSEIDDQGEGKRTIDDTRLFIVGPSWHEDKLWEFFDNEGLGRDSGVERRA